MLDPEFADLERLGLHKDNILFWFLYEFDQQYAVEFHTKEMKRIDFSGIHLNID